jgi:hypothetical protein
MKYFPDSSEKTLMSFEADTFHNAPTPAHKAIPPIWKMTALHMRDTFHINLMTCTHHPILCFLLTQTSSFPSSPPFLTCTSQIFNLYPPRSALPVYKSKPHSCFGHMIPLLSTTPKSSISNGVPFESGYEECGHS